ncbi:Ribonuclease H [Quillaja saponaria]|uniref:Ribonuclease H n=1 Tax=Quillaja saponaria TaxID=32244 RepID=A0AAD7KQ06_QUISA|nr:Ribonuclease H [Quillaja saponaria]
MGEWLAAFAANLGQGSNSEAELYGILNGLNLAWHMNIRKLQLEVDCTAAIEMITSDKDSSHPLFFVMQKCRNPLNRDWEIRIWPCLQREILQLIVT